MAAGNTPKSRYVGTIEEGLAPLLAATRPASSGRIRSLDEARRALRIPASAETAVLRVWGKPTDFELLAFPVADPEQPDLVAEFAVLRVIERNENTLRPADSGTRLRLQQKSNLLWIVYGSVVRAADHTLVLETLSLGPAFEGQLSHKGDDIAHGISAQLLRLLSPSRLLSETTERLLRDRNQLVRLEQPGRPAMLTAQRETYAKIEAGRPSQAHVSENALEAIARAYLELTWRGNKHPLPTLAQLFGITRAQARDRIHKARKSGYLKPGTQGRAGAQAGPRLKRWKPPAIPPPAFAE